MSDLAVHPHPVTGASGHGTGTTPVATQWAARARYVWHNSGSATVRRARRLLDSRRPVRTALLSQGSPISGPSFAYTGLPIGELNVLALLERRRRALTGAASSRVSTSVCWSALRRGEFPDADLVLVGGEDSRVRQLPRRQAFVLPFRVHLVVATDIDAETLRSRISKRERWEFARNRRLYDWEWEEDNSLRALRWFHDHLHVPTMRARHPEDSRTESLVVAERSILRSGRLFFLRENGNRVAGVLCHHPGERAVLTTRLLGVLDGDPAHYDSGAFKAVYHLLLEWACARGLPAVDFYGTEAFLSKGIFQWKRKFFPAVVLPPNHFSTKRIHLTVRRDTAKVRDFLVANPFLQLTPDGRLQPVYFHDTARPITTAVSAKTRDIAPTRHVDLDAFFDHTPTAARDE
ncbi:GNAT family N-acetyltransferase [Amycolatopsis anabasis]|uniref:GNAT family N-acetyltransferase n=1 Tax=Amycolatopsis anabasis TaxID=1840409 RepID=UPI00131CB0C8|nr:GNAT family N-acetyltransferase [Amycolatopsis anabasis]